MKIVVIIPTYNERENIIILLQSLINQNGFKSKDINYLVVDDSSPDGTEMEVKKFIKTHKKVFLLSGKKEGLGKALLRGMKFGIDKLKASIIIQMDGDLSHSPEVAPKLLAAIEDGADFAIGSRYISGGSIPENWGWHRKVYSRIGNMIVRFGLGLPSIHDWTGGFRAFKKIYYEKISSDMDKYNGYVFQIAFLHKSVLNGAKIVEVPFHFTDRKYGKSKIAPSEYIKNIILYILVNAIDRFRTGIIGKFALVGTIGFIINTLVLELFVYGGINPVIGSAVGAECAIISNFFLNNSWTFKARKIIGVRIISKFLAFNLTSFGAIIIQAGSVFIGTYFLGISFYRIFYILGIGLGLIWNFIMYSKVIWK